METLEDKSYRKLEGLVFELEELKETFQLMLEDYLEQEIKVKNNWDMDTCILVDKYNSAKIIARTMQYILSNEIKDAQEFLDKAWEERKLDNAV